MDSNVIGRMLVRGNAEFDRPRISTVAVLDVSDASHGNSVGIGLADFVPFRVLAKTDLRATYINALTAGLGGVQRARIPIALPTDESAVAAAILTCGIASVGHARVVRMRNTLELEHLLVSESLRADVEKDPTLEITGDAERLRFDSEGGIIPWV